MPPGFRMLIGLFVFVLAGGHLWLAITNLEKLRRLNPMYSGFLKEIRASKFGYVAASFLFLSIGLAFLVSATKSVFLLYAVVDDVALVLALYWNCDGL
jgi:hypothetical protein